MADSWIKFYPSDWLAGTRGMTAAETGVYITLIAMMYERGGSLDLDRPRLARLCGTTPATFQKIIGALIDDGKITDGPEGLCNDRVSKELLTREEYTQQAREAANKRWQKAKQNQRQDDTDPLPAQCERNANQNQNQNQKVEPSGSTHSARKPRPERFQEFWDQFPHRGGAKKGRGRAEQAYAKAFASGVPEPEIIGAAIRYANDAQVLRGYGKGPEPWLNQAGWQDEIEQHQFKAIQGGRDGDQYRNDWQSSEGRSNRPDPALEQIARLARTR